jgi:hypothetical protein
MSLRCIALLLSGLLAFAPAASAQEKKGAVTDPAQADADFAIQGEYAGEFTHDGKAQKTGIQIIALGDGKFHAVSYHGGLPGAGWDKGKKVEADGATKDGVTSFKSDFGKAEIKDGVLSVFDPEGKKVGECKRIERASPTLGLKPPEGAKVLFDGSSLDKLNGGILTDKKLLTPKGNIKSKEKFGSVTIHFEFLLPYMPHARGQGRANSGCYIADRYECQILDSFGLKGANNECGGFYTLRDPDQNMCFPPLVWQSYDIEYTAPTFDGDKKTKGAVVTVKHNGVAVHENYELPKETPGGIKESAEPGALHLQDHGNPVMFRNVWVVEKK